MHSKHSKNLVGGFSCLLLKKLKFSHPCLAEGLGASTACALVYGTVQTFHRNCNPHLESIALKKQHVTYLDCPQRSMNDDEG